MNIVLEEVNEVIFKLLDKGNEIKNFSEYSNSRTEF